MRRYLHTSVTRISDFERLPFEVHPLPRDRWATADYVVAEVLGPSHHPFEIANGRLVETVTGDLVIGALGQRSATLEVVGDWHAASPDGEMHALTGAGLFGLATSVSNWLLPLTALRYQGHVMRDGHKLTMQDYVRPLAPALPAAPVILIIGTSMSAGKTTTGRVVIHELKKMGLTVVGAKLTGAGRYRDSGMMGTPANDHPDAFWGADLDEAAERLAAVLR